MVRSIMNHVPGVCTILLMTNDESRFGPAGYQLLVGDGGRQELQQVLASPDPSIRMRGISLLASLATKAPDNVRALHESGTPSLSCSEACLVMLQHAQSPVSTR